MINYNKLLFTLFSLNILSSSMDFQKKLSLLPVKNSFGYLSYDFLEKMHELFNPDIFIETGTFLGDSTNQAAKIFDKVHSIEYDKYLFNKALLRLSSINNITLHEGDSSQVLKTLLPNLNGKLIFWLDGHYSGLHAGYETAISDNNTLIKELQLIKDYGHSKSIIIIDDIRLCDDVCIYLDCPVIGGYPYINDISKQLLEINPNYIIVIIGDVLLAYPKEENVKLSPVLEACTISRLSDSNVKDSIIDFEKIISNASGVEENSIKILNNTFGSDDHAIIYGVARHYILWHALILLKNKDYKNAYDRLNHIKLKGFNNDWQIDWYLAQAAYGLGNLEEVRNYFKKNSNNFSKMSEAQLIIEDELFLNNLL